MVRLHFAHRAHLGPSKAHPHGFAPDRERMGWPGVGSTTATPNIARQMLGEVGMRQVLAEERTCIGEKVVVPAKQNIAARALFHLRLTVEMIRSCIGS